MMKIEFIIYKIFISCWLLIITTFNQHGMAAQQTFDIDAFIQAPSLADSAQFGRSVAIHGDTMVVGAPMAACTDAPPGADCDNVGAAFVFRRDASKPNGWLFVQRLQKETPNADDRFGSAVAIWEDVILVGVPGDDLCGVGIVLNDDGLFTCDPNRGSVYVYARKYGAEPWQLNVRFASTLDYDGTGFGTAVAIYDAVIAIGMPGHTGCRFGRDPPFDAIPSSQLGCGERGAIFLVKTVGDAFGDKLYNFKHRLQSGTMNLEEAYGTSVALNNAWLVVGAPHADDCGTGVDPGHGALLCDDIGKAVVYNIADLEFFAGSLTLFKPSTEKLYARFGASVSVSDSTIVVGAPSFRQQPQAPLFGAVFLFTFASNGWVARGQVTPGPTTDSMFGHSVALAPSGKYLAVGAIGDKSCAVGIDGAAAGNGCANNGAVHLYKRTFSNVLLEYTRQHVIKLSTPGSHREFGRSVSLGDKLLVAGAPRSSFCSNAILEDIDVSGLETCERRGSVYAYVLTVASTPTRMPTRTPTRAPAPALTRPPTPLPSRSPTLAPTLAPIAFGAPTRAPITSTAPTTTIRSAATTSVAAGVATTTTFASESTAAIDDATVAITLSSSAQSTAPVIDGTETNPLNILVLILASVGGTLCLVCVFALICLATRRPRQRSSGWRREVRATSVELERVRAHSHSRSRRGSSGVRSRKNSNTARAAGTGSATRSRTGSGTARVGAAGGGGGANGGGEGVYGRVSLLQSGQMHMYAPMSPSMVPPGEYAQQSMASSATSQSRENHSKSVYGRAPPLSSTAPVYDVVRQSVNQYDAVVRSGSEYDIVRNDSVYDVVTESHLRPALNAYDRIHSPLN